jgi:hypothetical protein
VVSTALTTNEAALGGASADTSKALRLKLLSLCMALGH